MKRNLTGLAAAALATIIAGFTQSASAQQQAQRGPSTPEERAAIVELAKKLQQNPLDASLKPERERLLLMIIQVPDFTVSICGEETPWSGTKYKYATELFAAYVFSNAAHVIGNPDKRDEKAAHLTGLEGAIKAYLAIVAQEPEAKWQPMEDLIAKQQSGELRKALSTFCTKKN